MTTIIDKTSLSSAVSALSWSQGSDFVYVATDADVVLSVPLENCSSYLTCSECVASPDPLCGWCSVEAKCSQIIHCQNSDVIDRYIDNGQTGECFHTVTTDPEEFVTDLIDFDTLEVRVSVVFFIYFVFVSSFYLQCLLNPTKYMDTSGVKQVVLLSVCKSC